QFMDMQDLIIRDKLKEIYSDIYTPEALSALSALASFNKEIKALMDTRIKKRAERQKEQKRVGFLDPESSIPGTQISVSDARAGKFEGAVIPGDLQKQWIQGTGPAAKPQGPVE